MYSDFSFLRIPFFLLFLGFLGLLPMRGRAASASPHLALKVAVQTQQFARQERFLKSSIAPFQWTHQGEYQLHTRSGWIRPKIKLRSSQTGDVFHIFEQLSKSELAIATRINPNIFNSPQGSHSNWFVLQDSVATPNNSDPSMLDSWGGVNRGCSERPDGFGFPGFPPGSSRSAVEQMLGTPAEELPGYWSNTIALVYQLVPGQVSLGLLFDQNTQILAQTEASFDVEMGIDALFNTFNTMIGCRLDEKLRQGVRSVWSGEREVYDFNLGQIRGTIQWETSSRIYIGVWRSGLHSSLTRREFEPK